MTKIFVDLDGVLADFDSKARELVGPSYISGSKDVWKVLDKHPDFFRDLKLMPDASRLLVFLKLMFIDIEILTAVPQNGKMPQARVDKMAWVNDKLGDYKVNTCFAVDKQMYCTKPGMVLIDDNVKNIAQWGSRGGIGIFHVSAEETISCLKWFLKEKKIST
jgi:5'(3')-deoxyribonucleotidase